MSSALLEFTGPRLRAPLSSPGYSSQAIWPAQSLLGEMGEEDAPTAGNPWEGGDSRWGYPSAKALQRIPALVVLDRLAFAVVTYRHQRRLASRNLDRGRPQTERLFLVVALLVRHRDPSLVLCAQPEALSR
jgi:hypothetical protein